jgi:hypothetical protein
MIDGERIARLVYGGTSETVARRLLAMEDLCVSFSAWMPHALLAALTLGVLIGSCIRLGIDRAELAAYRRVSRGVTPDERERALAYAVAKRWKVRAETVAETQPK